MEESSLVIRWLVGTVISNLGKTVVIFCGAFFFFSYFLFFLFFFSFFKLNILKMKWIYLSDYFIKR